MNAKENVFGFSWKAISFRKLVVAPMIKLSVPVIVEKMAFSLGKVVVNSMSTVYGTLTVGALGISNNIGGITTNPQNGFQEGASAIISQNLGAGKKKRALKAFWCVLVMNLILSVILMLASLLCLHQIADLFANGDQEFAGRSMEIYRMEALGTIPLGASAAGMAFLYGYGKTKLTTAKIVASYLFGFAAFTLHIIVAFGLPLVAFGVDGWNLPLQINGTTVPYPLTFLQGTLVNLGVIYLVLFAMISLTLLLSAKMKSPYLVLIVLVPVLFIPLFVSPNGTTGLYNLILFLLPYHSTVPQFGQYISYQYGRMVLDIYKDRAI